MKAQNRLRNELERHRQSQRYVGTFNGRHCCAEARVCCIISTIRLSPLTIRAYGCTLLHALFFDSNATSFVSLRTLTTGVVYQSLLECEIDERRELIMPIRPRRESCTYISKSMRLHCRNDPTADDISISGRKSFQRGRRGISEGVFPKNLLGRLENSVLRFTLEIFSRD